VSVYDGAMRRCFSDWMDKRIIDISKDMIPKRHLALPWFDYLIGVVMVTAYQEFESRVGIITRSKGAQGDAVQQAIAKLPKLFKFSDIERLSPGVSIATIRRTLKTLKKSKRVRCIKVGKDALWEKSKGFFWDEFKWDTADAYWQ
jgi:hypothetical protein